MPVIYLDYAAATPLDQRVLAAMEPFFSEKFYNPSALYLGAVEAKQALEQARSKVARLIGARPSEITFTAGGTESANLAIQGVMQAYPGSELLVSAVEHDAVLQPARLHKAKIVPVNDKGIVDLEKLRQMITDKTVLISVMYANNEVGTIQPLREVTALVASIKNERRKKANKRPLLFHTDAAQAPNYLDVNVARLGIDLMTLNGGKLYGPKQSGILHHKIGVELSPQILGGGQEYGLRGGTENVAACIGFAKALELSLADRNETAARAAELSRYFILELEKRFQAVVNGHRKQRLPNNIHVTFPGCDNERILFSLDQQGIWAAAGSACSASSDEPSHVLMAMGINESDARASIRFSLGRQTTKPQIDRTLKALKVALKA